MIKCNISKTIKTFVSAKLFIQILEDYINSDTYYAELSGSVIV